MHNRIKMFWVTFKETFRQMILSHEKSWKKRRRQRRGANWKGKSGGVKEKVGKQR